MASLFARPAPSHGRLFRLAWGLAMVVLAGPINEVRSMLTGWYRLPREKQP